jgi:hypothetical protein
MVRRGVQTKNSCEVSPDRSRISGASEVFRESIDGLLPVSRLRSRDLGPPSADLFCQFGDDPSGATQVAKSIAVLVAPRFANKLVATGLRAGN